MRETILAGVLLASLVVVAGCSEEERERATAWELEAVSSDERTLTIAYEIGDPACEELSRVTKVETESQVELTVLLRDTNGKPCADIIMVEETSVRLESPLDGRKVVRGDAR